MKTFLLFISSFLLPIPIFIRGSVYFANHFQFGAWTSLALGLFSALVVWGVFGFWLTTRFSKLRKPIIVFRRVLLGLFIAQMLLGTFYISGAHLKNETLRDSYTDVHPILRMTIITTTIFSSDLVLTDLARTKEDYLKMGLRPLDFSLHFKQNTSYVHAIDIRTIGHSEWRNRFLQAVLWACGFSTKRHIGTADHLHVSLPIG